MSALLCPSVRADIAGATITKLSITGKGVVGKMIVGTDGNVWFLDQKNNAVGKMAVSGSTATLTEFPVTPPAGQKINFLRAMAIGSDGIWILFQTCTDGSCVQSQVNLGRVAQDGTITLKTVAGWSDVPTGMIAGPDGNFWTSDPNGRLVRVTQQGVATTFKPPSGRDAGGPIVGPDQAIWFTEPGYIGRLSSTGAFTEYPAGASYPAGLVVGPDNNLWFIAAANKLGRMKPDGSTTLFTLPDAQASPGGLAAGPDGNLWFTEHYDPKVGRLVVSSAKDDGTAQIDVQSFGFTLGKGNDIVVLPPEPTASGISPAGGLSGNLISNFMDSSAGGDIVKILTSIPHPDLTIEMSHWRDRELELKVTNVGVVDTVGSFQVVDDFPATFLPELGQGEREVEIEYCTYTEARLECNIPVILQPGKSYSVIVWGTLIGAKAGQTLTNKAVVSGGGDSNDANNTATDSFSFGLPQVTVAKTFAVDPELGTLTWTIVVRNPNDTATPGPLTITDSLPDGVKIQTADAKGQASCSLGAPTVTCTTPGPLAAHGEITIQLKSSTVITKSSYLSNAVTVSGTGINSAKAQSVAWVRAATPVSAPSLAAGAQRNP